MSIARTSLLALSLVLLSSLVIAADNPFARWDKANAPAVQPTPPKQPAVKAPTPVTAAPATSTAGRVSLEYFSASATETATPQLPPVPPETPAKAPSSVAGDAGNVVVERLKVTTSTASTKEDLQDLAAAQPNLPPSTPAAQQTASTSSAKANSVFTAAFESDQTTSGIQQTAAQFEEPTNATLNPFAEFLEAQDTESVGDDSQFAESVEFDLPSAPVSFEREVPAFDSSFSMPEPTTRSAVSSFQSAPAISSASGPQTPSVTVRWQHQGEFNVGQESRCDLVVENSGSSLVRNVVTEAVLPDGLEVISAEPAPEATNGRASWNFGDLQPGQTKTVRMVMIPRGQGSVELSAFVRLTGASTSTVAVLEPKLSLEMDGPASVEVGQLVNYTANVTNPGTGQARNVVIQAVIPDGLEHKRGKMLTIDIGTLNPGESRRARLSVTGVKGGVQKLAVRVLADGGLTDQVIEQVAVAEPQLNIGVRGPAQCVASQPNTYEVIVANEGNVESNNVRAKYKVPAGFEFVNADRGGKYNAAEQTIDWFVGTLDPGQMKQFNVSLRPSASGDFTHQVGVISEHGKMTMAEHTSSVQGHAKLTLSVVSSSPRVASNGGAAAFEIVVENKGSVIAEGVGVSCEIPPGLELVDIAGPSEYIADSGVIIFRALPTLAAGESAKFVIRTQCSRSGEHVARVRVASQSISRALIDEESVSGVSP